MRHHNHVTGKYLFQACCNCNLALKLRKCRIATVEKAKVVGGGDDDDDDWAYLVPIMFHNLSSYDGHFMLQFFRKEYTKYTTRTGTKAYADVGVIPLNGERNILLKIVNIVFVDSCQFLATSLDNLVKALRKSGVDKFSNTIRHFGSDDAYFEKGCCPYEYMMEKSKLDETELPPKAAFHNRLIGRARRRAVQVREAAVDEAQHDNAARMAPFVSLARHASSRRRIRGLQTYDDQCARTRLSALPQPTQLRCCSLR